MLLATAPVYGQDRQDEQPKAQSNVTAVPDEEPTAPSISTEQTPSPNPDDSTPPVRPTRRAEQPAYRYRPTQKRPPAAQYSPLAAQGGYWRPQTSPWQMIVDYFNPHHLNMGQLFEERKQNWLDNALYNEYFWYSFWVTFMLIMSWFVIAWIHEDRHNATWDLAECASDALRHSENCKREAKEAIRRHNDHIDKCNRIVEDRRSGRMTTPGTGELDNCKRELHELRNDNASLKLENASLKEQLETKHSEFQSLNARIAGVEQRFQSGGQTGTNSTNAELVARINRLEEENRRLQEPKKTTKAAVAQAEPTGNGQC
jgi:hypothetical protein